MDPCLKEMLIQTINVKSVTGYSATGGTPTMSAATEVAAYVEQKEDLISTASGQQVATTHFIVTEVEIKKSDRVWLPGEDPDEAFPGREPAKVLKYYDPYTANTVDHYEVWL